MELSIVTTLYRSSSYIEEFYGRIVKSAESVTDDFEIIFVNDGSPDDSLDLAVALHRRDSRVKVLDLSRNFGHHKAIMAGLKYACADKIFLIDCDLEESPELLTNFFHAMENRKDVDVFYGVQSVRKGGWLERTGGMLFYMMFNFFSGLNLHVNPLTIRIMSGRYVDALLLHGENSLFLAGIFEITGFKQEPVTIQKKYKGKSSYGILKRLKLMAEGITSFSSFPLVLFFYAGCVISLCSFIYAGYLTLRVLFWAKVVPGWTSLMVSLWFLSGTVLISLGIIGIYLSGIYYEVKKRPNFIIRRFYGKNKNHE